MIAPDHVTFEYLRGRQFAPAEGDFEAACALWRALHSDQGAKFDRIADIDAASIAPMVTWGTSPEAVTTVEGLVPDPVSEPDAAKREQIVQMLDYMALSPGQSIKGLPIDVVFIGSCTNSRIEDLRAAANVARGRPVVSGVRALVVPGSGAVKAQAELEGPDKLFIVAGFDDRKSTRLNSSP